MKIRSTIQRALVLETIREMCAHVTADEVYEQMIQKYPGIGRGTVYRNLNLLSDMGEIRRMEVPSGAVRYDPICAEHYHAHCVRCGRLLDVEMDYIADLAANIKNSHGFVVSGHDIVFRGTCPECNK